MTYYDTKPNPEIEATKERQRQRAHTPGSDTGSLSGPRQLGPREIKRRPLPTGPGLQNAQPADYPQPLRLQNRSNNTSPAQSPAYVSPQYMPQPQQWNGGPEGPDDYEQYSQPQPHPMQDDMYDFDPRYGDDPYYAQSTLPQVPMPQHPPLETRRSDPTPLTSSPHPASPYAEYSSSPPARSSPADLRRMSASPTKYAAYRDSPLRHSTTHQDIPALPPVPPKVPIGYANEPASPPPPPPPAHRERMPRPLALSYGTPPQELQSQYHESIGDRSPLQMIEHNYSPHATTPRSHRKSFNPADQPRPTSSTGEFPAPHQITPNYGVDFMADPVEQDQRGRYIRRNSFIEDHDDPYKAPQRSQTFDSADFDHRHAFHSDPQLVRPRARSPNPMHSVPRKSVSPAPPMDDRQMGSTPFGPDSYNALNPGSSPGVVRNLDWTEPKKERPHEIEPIIGNDGRVIDPSDHLPSDTWAPEPERKNRQPEHVIHIRTKGAAQHVRAGSSPAAPQTLSIATSPYSNSSPAPEPVVTPTSGRRRLQKAPPAARPLPMQPYQHANSSPGAIPQMQHFDAGGAVQHPRPVSSQGSGPAPHLNSFTNSPHSAGPHPHRNSNSSFPASSPHSERGLPRPPLSDYQGNPMSSNNGAYGRNSSYQTTPTKVQMPRPQAYAPPSVYDDPLAAELSMIDIGPSRGNGRTALRNGGGGRGYGGY